MRVLIAAIGTAGNALPFLGWGRALQQRGHDVVILGSPYLADAVAQLGAPFVPVDSLDETTESRRHNRPRDTRSLLRQVTEESELVSRRLYHAIAEQHRPGRTVIAASMWLFGARIAQEKLQIPLASVALQPNLLPRRERPVRRLLRRIVLRLADRRLGAGLNALRGELGLPPVSGILDRWWISPDLLLGFFPPWYADYQLEWPIQTVLAGFPLFDGLERRTDFHELDAFLAAGTPPLVFSQSSLSSDEATDFFRLAIDVAQRLSRRAVLLTTNASQVPQPLPPHVGYFGFVPISRLLPHSAALVHHGGLGTIAQALAAGIPQVTVPRFMDQPDNSRRLEALGVSANIRPKRLTADRLAGELTRLLNSENVRQACAACADQQRREPPFQAACDALEQLARLRGVAVEPSPLGRSA